MQKNQIKIIIAILIIITLSNVASAGTCDVEVYQTNVFEQFEPGHGTSINFIDTYTWKNKSIWTKLNGVGGFDLNSGTFIVKNCYIIFWTNYNPSHHTPTDTLTYAGPRWILNVTRTNGTKDFFYMAEQYQSMVYSACPSGNCRGWKVTNITIIENNASKVNFSWEYQNMRLFTEVYSDKPYGKVTPGHPYGTWSLRNHLAGTWLISPSDNGETDDWGLHSSSDYYLPYTSPASKYTFNIYTLSGSANSRWILRPLQSSLYPSDIATFIAFDDPDFAKIDTGLEGKSTYTAIVTEGGSVSWNRSAYFGGFVNEDTGLTESPNVARTAGQWYNSSLSPPFDGVWRMTLAIGYTSSTTDKDMHEWYSTNITNGQFRWQVPVSGTIYHAIYYPWNSTVLTPTNNFTVMDIYEMIWGNWSATTPSILGNPSESFSNILKESQPTTCFQSYPSGSSDCISANYISVGNNSYGKRWRSILDFNNTIPDNSTNASLQLVLSDSYDGKRVNPISIEVYGLNVTTNTSYTSWNTNDSAVSWSTPGGDWEDSLWNINGNLPFCTFSIPINQTIGTTYTCDVSNFIINNSISKAKFIIKANNTNESTLNNFVRFYSFRSDQSEYVPQLTINTLNISAPNSHTYGSGGTDWSDDLIDSNLSKLYNPSGYVEITSPYHKKFNSTLTSPWWWKRENYNTYALTSLFMFFNASNSTTDLWGTTATAPLLLQNYSTSSNFSIWTNVSVQTMSSNSELFAIIMYNNDTSFTWSGLQYGSSYSTKRTVTTVNHTSATKKNYYKTSIINDSNLYYLKLSKSGSSYTSSWSSDGTTYTDMNTVIWINSITDIGLTTMSGNTGVFKIFDFQTNQYNEYGNLTWWENTTSGYVASNVHVSMDSIDIPYNLYYGDNTTNFTLIEQGSASEQDFIIPNSTRYRNTTLRLQLLKNGLSTPIVKSVTTSFTEINTTNPEIYSWSNDVTSDTSLQVSMNVGTNATFQIFTNGTYDNIRWFVDNTLQVNNTGTSFLYEPIVDGSSTVSVYIENSNPQLTSNTVSWVITSSYPDTQFTPPALLTHKARITNSKIYMLWNKGSGNDTNSVLSELNSVEYKYLNETDKIMELVSPSNLTWYSIALYPVNNTPFGLLPNVAGSKTIDYDVSVNDINKVFNWSIQSTQDINITVYDYRNVTMTWDGESQIDMVVNNSLFASKSLELFHNNISIDNHTTTASGEADFTFSGTNGSFEIRDVATTTTTTVSGGGGGGGTNTPTTEINQTTASNLSSSKIIINNTIIATNAQILKDKIDDIIKNIPKNVLIIFVIIAFLFLFMEIIR